MTDADGHRSPLSQQGLRILLTNNTLGVRAGSELFLRDLAVSLMKRGHFPVAYSPVLGEVAEELSLATIPVIDDLEKLASPPDIIHGQHHLETVAAALYFPLTPALFVCHGWRPWEEEPPVIPSIRHYIAVDKLCRERVIATKGISPDDVTVIPNFVDLEKFPQRTEWSEQPRSALIFSNYAQPNDLRTSTIRAACRRVGIKRVDVIGLGAGNSHPNPGELLQDYDLVFAKARCALEAMATGAAVIVTDYAGLAGLVTSGRVEQMQGWNFGARTMQSAQVTEDNLVRELQRYDVADTRRVSDFIRSEANLEQAAERWLAEYRKVIASHAELKTDDAASFLLKQSAAASKYIIGVSPLIKSRHAAETRANLAEITKAEIAEQTKELVERTSDLTTQIVALRTELAACKTTLAAMGASRTWRTMMRVGRIKKSLFTPSSRPIPPFPVIVGLPRSGTTMLRFMLDSHPKLAIPPETGFLISPEILAAKFDREHSARLLTSFPFEAPAWNDYGIDAEEFFQAVRALPHDAGLPAVLRMFYTRYAARQHKKRGGDKTPAYLRQMSTVASILPEAHFIHIVRDGRDVALSWSQTWFAPTKNLPELVARWALDITAARAMAPSVKYLEVKYEDLVQQPETVLRSICSFIKLDFHPDMLTFYLRSADRLEEHGERKTLGGDLLVSKDVRLKQQWRTTLPPQTERIGVWRTQMSADDQALCQSAGAGLLKDA